MRGAADAFTSGIIGCPAPLSLGYSQPLSKPRAKLVRSHRFWHLANFAHYIAQSFLPS